MNKTEFVDALQAQVEGSTKKEAEKWSTAVIKTISDAVANGEKVQFVGFGSFETRPRAEKKVRNPRTGEELIAPATTIPVFKAGKALKEAVAPKKAAKKPAKSKK
ncbi:MAG: HU family DNA-binding protein [Oscillospiraceae bacterium]|jgi:DNA-binding protein HU-beta|nr:HU family DNA-binding protein [Oscillospiraceae bacterium]